MNPTACLIQEIAGELRLLAEARNQELELIGVC